MSSSRREDIETWVKDVDDSHQNMTQSQDRYRNDDHDNEDYAQRRVASTTNRYKKRRQDLNDEFDSYRKRPYSVDEQQVFESN